MSLVGKEAKDVGCWRRAVGCSRFRSSRWPWRSGRFGSGAASG